MSESALPRDDRSDEHYEALMQFARDCLRAWWDSYEGEDLQECGIKYGLLVATVYDPDVHGEDDYAEPGDEYYVFAPWFKAAIEILKARETDMRT